MKINWGTISTTLICAGIIGFIGAVMDFQNLKAKVERNTNQLSIIGLVLCDYSIRDEMPISSQTCKKMMKGN